MEAEIAAGKNPYADLITLSKGNDWKVQMGIGGNDVVTAKDPSRPPTATTVCPGSVVKPVVQVSRCCSSPGTSSKGRLQHQHESPGHCHRSGSGVRLDPALRDLVHPNGCTQLGGGCGRREYRHHLRYLPQGQHPRHRSVAQAASGIGSGDDGLQNLVSGATPPTLTNLDDVTAPGIAITRQVIEAIREMPPTEQGLIIGRLVEISTARTVEKALYARRLLLTGRQVPEVYATEVAREHADASIAELDKEIDNLLFETRAARSGLRHNPSAAAAAAAAAAVVAQCPQVSPVDPAAHPWPCSIKPPCADADSLAYRCWRSF